ncbi:hypothetical protein MSS93_01540 [Deinococcus radiodurans]|nr:hypothetical protein MSS93_01540 [Deinococcus radiodurans]
MTDRSDRSQLAFARLLPRLFRGGQAYVGVEATLSDLSSEQAAQHAGGCRTAWPSCWRT